MRGERFIVFAMIFVLLFSLTFVISEGEEEKWEQDEVNDFLEGLDISGSSTAGAKGITSGGITDVQREKFDSYWGVFSGAGSDKMQGYWNKFHENAQENFMFLLSDKLDFDGEMGITDFTKIDWKEGGSFQYDDGPILNYSNIMKYQEAAAENGKPKIKGVAFDSLFRGTLPGSSGNPIELRSPFISYEFENDALMKTSLEFDPNTGELKEVDRLKDKRKVVFTWDNLEGSVSAMSYRGDVDIDLDFTHKESGGIDSAKVTLANGQKYSTAALLSTKYPIGSNQYSDFETLEEGQRAFFKDDDGVHYSVEKQNGQAVYRFLDKGSISIDSDGAVSFTDLVLLNDDEKGGSAKRGGDVYAHGTWGVLGDGDEVVENQNSVKFGTLDGKPTVSVNAGKNYDALAVRDAPSNHVTFDQNEDLAKLEVTRAGGSDGLKMSVSSTTVINGDGHLELTSEGILDFYGGAGFDYDIDDIYSDSTGLSDRFFETLTKTLPAGEMEAVTSALENGDFDWFDDFSIQDGEFVGKAVKLSTIENRPEQTGSQTQAGQTQQTTEQTTQDSTQQSETQTQEAPTQQTQTSGQQSGIQEASQVSSQSEISEEPTTSDVVKAVRDALNGASGNSGPYPDIFTKKDLADLRSENKIYDSYVDGKFIVVAFKSEMDDGFSGYAEDYGMYVDGKKVEIDTMERIRGFDENGHSTYIYYFDFDGEKKYYEY